MNLEKGIIGLISLQGRKFTIDQWTINNENDPWPTAVIECNSRKFRTCFEIPKNELHTLMKTEFFIRLDNEDHIYYGVGKVYTVAKRKKCIKKYPKLEYYYNDLIILFEMICHNYGPYTLREGVAMARNGNDLFFDLLNVEEMDENIQIGDLRFLNS